MPRASKTLNLTHNGRHWTGEGAFDLIAIPGGFGAGLRCRFPGEDHISWLAPAVTSSERQSTRPSDPTPIILISKPFAFPTAGEASEAIRLYEEERSRAHPAASSGSLTG